MSEYDTTVSNRFIDGGDQMAAEKTLSYSR
jgi:hypothetical protein